MNFETDIPIPATHRGSTRKKFHLEQMQLGQSLLVPYTGYKQPSAAVGAVCKVAARVRIKHGFKFTLRSLSDGVRIWRVG